LPSKLSDAPDHFFHGAVAAVEHKTCP
jgi:hypothetical protein